MAVDPMTMKVTPLAHREITLIKDSLERQEGGRQVTYSETLTRMAALWNRAVAAVDAKGDA
jgi:hypothetical protein